MTRNLDATMAPHLADGRIMPVLMAELTLKSGVVRCWTGIGDLVWSSKTFTGVGNLASVGAITENSAVKAEGTTVTLSGIGLSGVDLPTPISHAPPFTPPAGHSWAWAIAKTFGPPGTLFIPASVFTGGSPVTGGANATATAGAIAINGGYVFPGAELGLEWLDFQMPPEIPVGAPIVGVYACTDAAAAGGFTVLEVNGASQAMGTATSANLHAIAGVVVGASAGNSLPLGSSTLGVGFVALAVLYEGEPLSSASLVYEALNDIRLGGPAKIWFGLWADGAFIGNPYLVFRGTVDQPTVTTSPQNGTIITLALENRLVNMQRASMRKYTSADQRIEFPDDTFFAFVEILQSIALREGIA